jgi:hypothetical protein
MKQEFVLRVLLYCTELEIPKWESLCVVEFAAILGTTPQHVDVYEKSSLDFVIFS